MYDDQIHQSNFIFQGWLQIDRLNYTEDDKKWKVDNVARVNTLSYMLSNKIRFFEQFITQIFILGKSTKFSLFPTETFILIYLVNNLKTEILC